MKLLIYLTLITILFASCGSSSSGVSSNINNTNPTIKLIGAQNATIYLNDNYVDLGAIASDLEDGNLTSKIVKKGSVDSSKLGIYTITYSVTDSGGSKVSIDRVVNVTRRPSTNFSHKWDLSSSATPLYKLSTTSTISDFSTIIYPNHPRLYFRDSDKDYMLRANQDVWRVIEATITKPTRFTSNMTKEQSRAKLKEFEYTEYPQLLTLYSYLSDNQNYKEMVIDWAINVLSREKIINDSSKDISIRTRIARLSEVYDWLYSDLSSSEKRVIRDALKSNIDTYMSWDYVVHPNYIQSHSRWGHGVVEKGLLAMYGDFDENFTKEYADSMLSKIREHLRNYEKVEGYIAKDGGWHLGWMYAYFYANYTFNYLVWSSATNESMLNDWMGELTYWFIYALRADYTLPQMGDANINSIYFGDYAALYQAKYQKDGYAKWYLDKEKEKDYYNNYLVKLLLTDKTVQATTPSSLPTSRYFKNAGVVVARDSWDFEKATMLIFKSSPFYSAGHHHRDENSFTIDYKRPLAVDSGYYDRANSNHAKNYYVRTIAHNAITVYNPNQTMYYKVHYNKNDPLNSKIIPNDGGQIYKEFDPVTLDDIKTKAKLGGVTKYYFDKDYTYIQGDATKAYDPITVSLEKRDIVYLKNSSYPHPVTIILDRVESKDPTYQKRYLLHMDSDDKPTITSNKTTVISKGVKMTNVTLYPTDASLVVVGDVDRSKKEAYPYYDGKILDTAPLDNEIVRNVNRANAVVGNWRLEVAPKTGSKYDVILNAIFVGDEDETISNEVYLISSTNSIGVELKDRVVLFLKDKSTLPTPLEYSTVRTGKFKHTLVTNYAKGENLKVYVDSNLKTTVTVKDGGCVDFTLDTTQANIIKVTK